MFMFPDDFPHMENIDVEYELIEFKSHMNKLEPNNLEEVAVYILESNSEFIFPNVANIIKLVLTLSITTVKMNVASPI